MEWERPWAGIKRNSTDTRTQNLEAAIRKSSSAGFSGARIERIAKGAKCNVRMLYHYFGNKEDLYRGVLVHCYARIRNQEADLNLEKLPLSITSPTIPSSWRC